MIEIWVVLYLLFLHWVADFVLQSEEMANEKSKSIYALTMHIIIYGMIMLIGFIFFLVEPIFYVTGGQALLICFLISIFHWITDFITSKINKKLYKQKKIHKFFVSVGFDQWLHVAQILLIYGWIT